MFNDRFRTFLFGKRSSDVTKTKQKRRRTIDGLRASLLVRRLEDLGGAGGGQAGLLLLGDTREQFLDFGDGQARVQALSQGQERLLLSWRPAIAL